MMQNVKADVAFAFDNFSEFRGRLCSLMRYVVAINPEMTLAQWLKVAHDMKWNIHTARSEFHKSRAHSAEAEAMVGHTRALASKL
jgi:hypothetical protein